MLNFFSWEWGGLIVPPPSLPPSQMTAVSLVRAVIDDQFSLPKLTERLQNPGGYQYFVVEK